MLDTMKFIIILEKMKTKYHVSEYNVMCDWKDNRKEMDNVRCFSGFPLCSFMFW